jgi:hypothetical protein
MEPIVSSETSASNTQTPGIYPKESELQYWSDLHHYHKQRKVVVIIDRALLLSHNNLQISKNNLVWKNEARVELNCNVIYQVSPETRELEVLATISMKLGNSVLHRSNVTFSTIHVLSVKS